MRGKGKLAGLPELTKIMERSLMVGIIVEHTPESCEWMDATVWAGFVLRSLELLSSTEDSYWHYSENDGHEIIREVRRLEGAGYIETKTEEGSEKRVFGERNLAYIRRLPLANYWLNRLKPQTREWLDFFGGLDLLDKLAGL
jgi:hypothetical protein